MTIHGTEDRDLTDEPGDPCTCTETECGCEGKQYCDCDDDCPCSECKL